MLKAVASPLVAVVIFLTLFVPMNAPSNVQTIYVPSGILHYVPVSITNSQPSATPTPFQQMVQIDSSTYGTGIVGETGS